MLTLRTEKRNVFGKKLKTARQAGKLPVVVYGGKEPPAVFFVSAIDFKKIIGQAGKSGIVSLETSDGKRDVLIHDIARHPVSGEAIHADFYVIDKTKKIEVEVPLHFEGVAPAIKDFNGTLVKVLHEFHVKALPFDIPREVVVDVSSLATLESQLLVKDVKVPPGVEVLNHPDEVVAAVSEVREEVEEAPPADLSAIEVEKKGKKEEEDEAAPEAKEEEK